MPRRPDLRTAEEQAAYAAFKTFCETYDHDEDLFAEEDWRSLSIGFFVAMGVEPGRALSLSSYVRYTDEYWSANA